jgi:hypothetical protein
VLSLTARGLTTGEVAAHFADVYGASVSKDTIFTITDEVLEEMTAWRHSPLDRVYPVVFIDAIVVKVRDGQAVNPPVYVAIGVTTAGERDILGLWAGDGGEGAKHWLQVLTEIKNRGVEDVCILVCDGLRGLPDSVGAVWRPAPPPGRPGRGAPIAATSPACASEVTSRTPVMPRATRSRKKVGQPARSSALLTCRPRISRWPSAFTPVSTSA